MCTQSIKIRTTSTPSDIDVSIYTVGKKTCTDHAEIGWASILSPVE